MTPPALLLLLLFISLAEGHVVQSFKGTCGQFFITDPKDQNNHIPPTILTDNQDPDRYKQICQRYSSQYRYATLYDTKNKIPVYSAYKYTGQGNVTRRSTWKIEPQLDNVTASPNMSSESSVNASIRGTNQSLNKDFNSTLPHYEKGHLYPVCHTDNQPCAYATFTLTNAAPQTSSNNKKWYIYVEKNVTTELKKNCNTAHIVTGVVPGSEWMNRRVNVPSHFWTAYCCTGKQGAFLAQTNPRTTYKPQNLTVEHLNLILTSLYGSMFEVFGSVCK
ncbi:endonuclease domain-containing 1 protein-like [Denticeps clupeoides]|uniref:Endonuclease domain-containing 1 protein-like n=1 Tax=Denticeps clupeoides TaxID=299321 RepID=A0AAY3ZYV6_9TELE|nr:endonuclease domain-containing 1 protein-like [Denticeps clupeoides]